MPSKIIICLFILLTAVPVMAQTKTVTLTWTANVETDLKGYRIYRDNLLCSQQGPKQFQAEVGKVTTWADPAIPTADFIVSYDITAIDTSLNESLKSNCVEKTFFVAPTKGTLTAGPVTTTSVEVTLGTVSDGAGGNAKYDLRYAIAPALTNAGWATATKHTACVNPGKCVITGLKQGTKYELQATTYRGTTATSGPISAILATTTTVDTTKPAPPVQLKITAIPGDGTIVLGWVQPGGTPDKNNVLRLNQTTGDWILLASLPGDALEAIAPLPAVGRRLYRVCSIAGQDTLCGRDGVWAAQ